MEITFISALIKASGKSLIYQAIPIIVHILNDNLLGTSTVLVISLLTPLMTNQIQQVNAKFAISAAGMFENQDKETLNAIENGCFSLV